MAEINKNEGEYRRAFAIYNSILDDEPENVAARLELAKVYFAGKQDQTALEHIDKILEKDNKNKEALLIVAAIESRRGNSALAVSTAETRLALLRHHGSTLGR
jgi:Tfp pilus assembly protein PilF